MNEDEPLCSVCLGAYVRPCQWPCGHSLCGTCHAGFLEQGAAKRVCSICRVPLGDGGADLPINFALHESAEYIAQLKSRLEESGRKYQDALVRIDVLESRLPSTEAEAAATNHEASTEAESESALIEKLHLRTSALHQSLRHKELLLDKAERSLAQQLEHSGELQTQLASLQGRVMELGASLEVKDLQLGAGDAKLRELRASLEAKDKRLEAAEARLREVDAQRASVEQREASLAEQETRLAKDAAGLQAQLEEAQRDAKAIAAKINDKLKAQVKSQATEMATLQKSLKTKSSQLDSLKKEMSEQKETVKTLQNQLTSSALQVHSLQDGLAKKNARLKELHKSMDHGALAALSEREQKLARMETEMAREAAEHQANMSETYAELDAKLSNETAKRNEELAKRWARLRDSEEELKAAARLEGLDEGMREERQRSAWELFSLRVALIDAHNALHPRSAHPRRAMLLQRELYSAKQEAAKARESVQTLGAANDDLEDQVRRLELLITLTGCSSTLSPLRDSCSALSSQVRELEKRWRTSTLIFPLLVILLALSLWWGPALFVALLVALFCTLHVFGDAELRRAKTAADEARSLHGLGRGEQ